MTYKSKLLQTAFVHITAVAIAVLQIGCMEVQDKEETAKPVVQAQMTEWTTIDAKVVLTNQKMADDLGRIQNLYLTKNAVIVTNGFKVSFKLQNLKSEDALIQSFPLYQSAADFVEGRSGGYISIEAVHADGLLRVEMRGENGGKGKKGQNPPGIMGPAKGVVGNVGCAGGNSGFLFLSISNQQNFRLLDIHEPGIGGEGGEGGDPIAYIGYGFQGTPEAERGTRGDVGAKGPSGPMGRTCFIQPNGERVCDKK